jgi:hypothetical protein
VKVHHVSLILQLTCNLFHHFPAVKLDGFMENPMKNGGFWGPISGNLRKPPCFPTSATESQACGVAAGQVLLLVPRIGELGQRNFAAVRRGVPRVRDVGNMGQNWQRSALHSNFDHIVHIISYIISINII